MAMAAVAAGNEATAQAAARTLEAGGNAFDAALAGMTAACITEPVLCSFGGGGFLMAQPAGASPHIVDFFTQTPGRSSAGDLDFKEIRADFGTATQPFHIGRAAAAVPGMVAGLFHIHETLARLPLAEALAPALELARKGSPLDPLQAHILEVVHPIVTDTAAGRAQFCCDAGRLLSPGAPFRLHGFDGFLDALIADGPDLFYRGEVADALVRDCADGGLITHDDLARYRVAARPPRHLDYRGADIAINDLPSSGGPLIAYALTLLGGLDGLPADDVPGFAIVLADIMARTGIARRDSGFADKPAPAAAGRLFDAARIAGDIRALKTGGTTHLSIVDSDGALASLSLSNGEGNGRVIPGTGIVMNNMLGEEDLNPGGFFRWRPNSRVSSMMSPCIAALPDGRTVALGSGGSNRIRSAVLQTIVRMIDGKMETAAAISAPRIHVEHGRLSIEDGFPDDTVSALITRYPDAQVWPGKSFFFGGVHVAGTGPSGPFATGDPRRGGAAVLLP